MKIWILLEFIFVIAVTIGLLVRIEALEEWRRQKDSEADGRKDAQ